MATTSTFLLIPILFIILSVPILMAVYVYRDAKARDMNPGLWTFLVLFVPSFMGFIIYLVVRGNYSGLMCPNCGSGVEKNYSVCPKCGTRLKGNCASCGRPIEPDWKVCPHCAAPINALGTVVQPPVRRQDRGLGKVLTAIVSIPLALLALILVFSFAGTGEYSGAMNTFMTTTEGYLSDKNDERISTWIENCPYSYDRVYILKYETLRDDQKATHHLIYLPFADENTTYEMERGHKGFGKQSKVELFLEGSGIGTGGYIFGMSTYGDDHTDLVVYYNGKELEMEVTSIDFNPMIFEIVGEEVE